MLTKEEVEELYQRTGALILRRCRFLLGDEAEAFDVLQDVFIRVMRYGDSLRQQEVPLAWLYRTAERCCFDRLKKSKRESVGIPDELIESLALPDWSARPEAAKYLKLFFHRLKPKLRQVALLHYVDGLSQEQIATQMGWSRKTVGKKIKQLREIAASYRRKWEGS